MLFHGRILEGIRSGGVTRAYRRASRPPAKVGGTQRVDDDGVVEFTSVERVAEAAIGEDDARAAGYESRAALMRMLAGQPNPTADIYCVGVRYAALPDPRVALRQDAAIAPDDLDVLRAKLDRMDRSSGTGPWTRATLDVIAANPGVVSTKLAAIVGMERLAFKANVRKLKALGLTISHEVGYELSPRGRALMRHMEESTT